MLLQENIPLAPLTTFRLGGPARFFVKATSAGAVQEAVAFAAAKDVPLFVLGGGSNLVIADSGWPGLVVKIGLPGGEMENVGDNTVFSAGAGEDWDKFVALTVDKRCAGLECMSGIPGTVGGTPV